LKRGELTELLKEITTDEELERLLHTKGFLVNVDYPTKDVKLHKINCRFCDPKNPKGVKPSSKKLNNTGEFWHSTDREETDSKAEEIAAKKGFNYSLCRTCKP